jgi:tetratricopeptide (TPR) repeat protein
LQFSKLGYFEPALADYNKAIALNPNYMLAYNDRGATYLSTQQYPQALNDFDKAIELDPKFARSYLGRALAQEGLNNSHAALLNYQQLCALGFTDGCIKLKPVLN